MKPVFRPQFPRPPAPEGFEWQPCVYQFDITNTPAFASLSLSSGQETGHIPLPLDHDALFVLLGVKVQNSPVNLKLWDAHGNELMDDFIKPAEYAPGLSPFAVLENGAECPPGSVLQVRIQGQ